MNKFNAFVGFLVLTVTVLTAGSMAELRLVPTTAGNMRMGMTRNCRMVRGYPDSCSWPHCLLAFLSMLSGVVSLTLTCALLLLAHWAYRPARHIRWVALLAMTSFCLAAIIIPIGFGLPILGGGPHKMPRHTPVGAAYLLFILLIFSTVVTELFASQMHVEGLFIIRHFY